MGTTALRQLLKSLCSNSPWKYAVFWKLRHQEPMCLNWGGGYCVYTTPRESVESISSDVYSGSEIIPLHFATGIHNDHFGGYPIGLVVNNMSQLKYEWGEGVVGKVANTGKHCWVFDDDVFTGKAYSKFVPECPEEWLIQFASGIKTIVLVPVLPHGVLQLGSVEMVPEDLSITAYIKDRFSYKDIHSLLPSPLLTTLLLEESAPISPLNSEDSNAIDSVKPNKFTKDQIVPLLSSHNAFQIPGIDLHEFLENEHENKISFLPLSLNDVSMPLSQPIYSNQLAVGGTEQFGLSFLKEELQTYPDCNGYTPGECEEILNAVNPYASVNFLEPHFGEFSVDGSGFLGFPDYCELHKALEPAFGRQCNEYFWETFFDEGSFRELFDGIEPTPCTKGGDAEYLLQAVVGDDSVGIANRSNHFITSTGKVPLSSQHHSLKGDSTPLSRLTPEFIGGTKDKSSSKISASFKSTVSTITDDDNLGKDFYCTQSRKGQKQSGVSKKRSKPGENPKPRPRDRQMIQDRLKELRELVPDGAKYSIDALLDQTVKHMLYLRSVTDQAEKLRQWVHKEVTGRKNLRSSEPRDVCQNGTSWAFEIGDELKVCPIVVEDLAYPGHLLIEMLCNEHGLFLEIAQVIRSFNLTILKGVMESCSNNTWAHFIVEASGGFHRLDIFWPLMQLLQRQRNSISCKI